MYKTVRKLQKKSDRQKRTILAACMIVSVIVVGGLWAVSLNKRFSGGEVFRASKEGGAETEREEIAVEKPFGTLTEAFKSGLASVQLGVSGLKGLVGGGEEKGVPAFPLPVESQ